MDTRVKPAYDAAEIACPGRAAAFFALLRRAGIVPNTEPSWPGLIGPSDLRKNLLKRMDARAFASPKGLRPRRRVKPARDERIAFVTAPGLQRTASRRAKRCAASGARLPWQRRASHQKRIDRPGAQAAFADRPHHQRLAA